VARSAELAAVLGALHDDELPIDVDLVRALVDRDLPQYSGLPLRPLGASGSTNALYRLGEELLVRLPRQPGSGAGITKEARWCHLVGQHLPVDVPEIEAIGEPGFGYPEQWSVVRWLEGEVPHVVTRPGVVDPARAGLARDLAGVVTAIRDVDLPPDALSDPDLRWYRGDPLALRDAVTRQAVDECSRIEGLGLDLDAVLACWEEAMTLPGAGGTSVERWYHGDLLAENLLVRDGHLTAVLDFGGLAVGDPTVDLMVAWEVLDVASRRTFRESVGADESTWLRGRAWALTIAVNTFPYYWRTMPERCADRQAIVRAVLHDAGLGPVPG
jgi:aminoglycoside phosphotransferase (APT) family kinase protein